MSSNNAALASKEWHFSDEWEQFSLEKPSDPENQRPILSQDEIDSLLSHFNTHEPQVVSGFQHLLGIKHFPYEEVPFFDDILLQFSQEFLTNLRLLVPFRDKLNFLLQNKTTVLIKDYISDASHFGMMKMIKSKEWNCPLLINLSAPCIYSLIETLLGGQQANVSGLYEEKPFTKIEENLVYRFIHFFLKGLEEAFSEISKSSFYIEKKDILPNLIKLKQYSNTALLLKFAVQIESFTSFIDLLFPASFLEHFKDKINCDSHTYKPYYVSPCKTYLEQELPQTNLFIEAILNSTPLPLETVLNWRVGTQIDLNIKPSTLIPLQCGGLELMLGKMGECNNSIAIQIEHNKLNSAKEEQ